MNHIDGADRVTATIKKLVCSARIIGLPIIANTQYKKGLGPYVTDLEGLMVDVPRPDKVEFNALANAETRELVKNLPATVHTAIVVGVETHICIYQTACGVQELGFTPWIVADGVSSRTEENHLLGLARLRDIGATVGPAEMILYELLGRAGTTQFKEVLPYIL